VNERNQLLWSLFQSSNWVWKCVCVPADRICCFWHLFEGTLLCAT